MVATMDNNWLVRELFEAKDDSVVVKGPSDWSALVQKILDVLPLKSLRRFCEPTELNLGFFDMGEDGYSFTDLSYKSCRFCVGISETSHLLDCGILTTKETARTRRVLHLVMNRKGEFFTAESVWDFRRYSDNSYRDQNLRFVIFTAITIDSLCSKFTDRVGEVVIATLYKVVAYTEREVKRQSNDLERQRDMIHGVARRIGVSTR